MPTKLARVGPMLPNSKANLRPGRAAAAAVACHHGSVCKTKCWVVARPNVMSRTVAAAVVVVVCSH